MEADHDSVEVLQKLFLDFPELLREDVTWEKEIYAHFGLLYMGFALLEHSLINAATIKLATKYLKQHSAPVKSDWEKCHDLAFVKSCDQTLGNLIKIVVEIPEFKILVDDLAKVKKIRDYFSHHFFRREAAHMGDRSAALALIIDISEARHFIDTVELSTRPSYSKYVVRLGLPMPTEDFIEEESTKLKEGEMLKLARNELPRGIERWIKRGEEL